ncbi:g1062 [Coccomyxa elongata]
MVFEGFVRVVDRSWISVFDVVQVATGFTPAMVEEIAREKLPDHVRCDVSDDGSPFVDFQGFVQLLSNLGTLIVAFTRLAADRIVKHFCDDANRFNEIDEQIGEIDDRNKKDEDYPRYRCRVLEDDTATLTTCECCKAGPWTTRFEVREHFAHETHVAKALSEVEGCDICDRERFRSEAARAAHLLTKSHLDAAERAERREQRRLGHRVQGRAHAARAAREERPAILRMEDYAVEGTEGSDRPQLHRVGRAFPRRQVPVPTPLGDPVPEAPTDESTGQDASDAAPEVPRGPTLVIESAPGPSDRAMIVAETAAGSIDRAGEVDGCSDAPQDDFVTYLLSRFSEPQKRMFAESYGVYMREDMRNKHCIDLDLAFEWLGYVQKGKAVALVISILQAGVDYILSRSGKNTNQSSTVGRRPDKYYLTPRAFKKVLMRARTAQGDAATDYFLEIEDALLAYNTLKRTNMGVSQFDSSAKARRNGLRLRSVTDSINTHVSGLYFGVPERTWAMLKPLNPSYSPSLLAVDRAEMTVIKFGMKRGDTDRTEQHCTAFQGFYLLDHVPTEHMAEVEDLLKAWLRNEGLLFEGLHENRKSRDTELTVVVTQADYTRVVERTLLLIKQTDDKKRRLLGVGECAREEEARAEQEKAKAEQEKAKADQEKSKAVQMTETTAQLAFQARMAELELVKLGLLPAQALSAFQPHACTSS